MKIFPLVAICVAGAFCETSAPAQLVEQRVVGSERLCIYFANPVGKATRTLRVGIGQPCPDLYPVADSSRAAPPTAGLQSSAVVDGRRRCVYGQRSRSWTFTVPLDAFCAPTAGMLAANAIVREAD